MRRRVSAVLCAALLSAAGLPASSSESADPTGVGEAALGLTRGSRWIQLFAVRLGFDAYHPQGMVKVGDAFFVTSVEILERTRPYAERRGGFDRDQGRGQGWLFKINGKGELLAKVRLGEGAIYHAGGLDFDGRHLWVPVAEYRPGGASIIYRVEPQSLDAVEVLRIGDHIGAVARDPAGRRLVGVNWGGRRFYAWPVDRAGRVDRAAAEPTPNPSHYVDYQDCHGAGAHRMLCTGVAYYRAAPDRAPLALGGAELLDLRTFRPIWQAPVPAWTASGASITTNAAVFEAVGGGLRGYFIPEDGQSTLYTYETSVTQASAP